MFPCYGASGARIVSKVYTVGSALAASFENSSPKALPQRSRWISVSVNNVEELVRHPWGRRDPDRLEFGDKWS